MKKKQKKDLIWSVGREFTGYLLDLMICIYMLLIIIGIPLYHQEGFLHIGTDKANFFREISVVGAGFLLPVLAVYLVTAALERKKPRKLSVTDKFALVYGAALLLSYVSSDYQETALWGADKWYMGLLPQLFLLGIYFFVSRFWEIRAWMAGLFLPISAVVFLLGYLNRFDIFPINMQVENVQFISTVGNINWYCGYLVSVFFGGFYVLWQSDVWNQEHNKWKQLLIGLYVAVGFATLITQGSMSGLFTLGVMVLVTFYLSVGDVRRLWRFWQGILLFSLVCFFTWVVRNCLGREITYTDGLVDLLTDSMLPIFMTFVSAIWLWQLYLWEKQGKYPKEGLVRLAKLLVGGIIVALLGVVILIGVNTLSPGSLGVISESSFFTFSPTWGSNRATTWKTGIMCFLEQNLWHKLVGVGPDCMSAFLYQNGSIELQELVKEVFGSSALTNAHNEWLTVLVDTGILGAVGYVGMMVSGSWRFFKYGMKSHKVVPGACGFCLIAYTVNNIFSFQQSVSTTTIFMIMGIGEAYARSMRLSWFIHEKMGNNRQYGGHCSVCFFVSSVVK